MGKVIKSVYRQPVTSKGLKNIEKGTLEWFDTDMFSNVNTGVLEQYLNEKNAGEGFDRSHFVWWKVAVGICIGLLFAVINQYVGLKVGIIVGGTWYVAYLVGLMLKWDPTEINIASGAGTGTDRPATGFVFTFPAIYLLAKSVTYAVGGTEENPEFLIDEIPNVAIPMVAAMLGAIMGVMYFVVFRRVWLVEDPLPMPGFEASVKLADIANDISTGAVEHARRSIKLVGTWTGLIMGFIFLRDFPIMDNNHKDIYGGSAFDKDAGSVVWDPEEKISIMNHHFTGNNYHDGDVVHPDDTYTSVGFNLTPIQLAIGLFMRFRAAMLVSMGSLITWFIIIPMTVAFDVPVYLPLSDAYFNVKGFDSPAFVAYAKVARIIAIGAILGGGLTALAKMWKVFGKATADMRALVVQGGDEEETKRLDWVEGKGWYEWPITHIPVMMGATFLGVGTIFFIGGYPFWQSYVFSALLVILTFFLGAIAVKVMGETGTTPVSGTSFIILIVLVSVFKLMGTGTTTTLVMALVGTTVFGTSISLAGDITHDFKIGIYAGTRPYHLVKGEITGIIPGTIVAAVAATIFSEGLATGDINLRAPQANAFATFAQMMAGGETPWNFLFMGILIGIWAEFATGMGTAFGLGMYLPMAITLPLLLGGAAREYWTKTILEPKAKREGWDEHQKTMVTLETYMVATGLIVGEALMGTIVAFWIIFVL